MQKVLPTALLLSISLGLAQPAADKPGVQISSPTPIEAGSEINLSGKGFVPASKINVKYEAGANLTAGNPFTVAADGTFRGKVLLPAGATVGAHILNVLGSEKQMVEATVTVVNNPKVAVSGAERFKTDRSKLVQGLYQVAYSAKNDVLWVTAAMGREAKPSALLKIDPKTLDVVATYDVLKAGADGQAGFGAYGVGVDDVTNTVWVTNTRANAVSVYSQADGTLLKVLPYEGSHTREVVIDGTLGKAFVSNVNTGDISVIDTRTYAVKNVKLSAEAGSRPTGLALDPVNKRLYVADLGKNTLVVMDTAADAIVATYPLGVVGASSVGLDVPAGKAYVTSQQSAELSVVDLKTGAVTARIETGLGALSVSVDPATHTVYVSNRGAGTVTVVDGTSNKVVANLQTGSYPNHQLFANGALYAVNKSLSGDDTNGDLITRLTPVK